MTEPATSVSKKNPLRIIIPLVVLLVVAGISIKLFLFNKQFPYAGTLEATEVDIPARLASVIATVDVQEGQRVQKNAQVVSLSCEDIAPLAELNDTSFIRVEKLYKSGTAPKEQYDIALNKKTDSDIRMGWCHIFSPISGRVLTRYLEPGEWVNPGTKLVSVADLNDIWAYIYVPQNMVHGLKPGMKIKGTLPEMGGQVFHGAIRKINAEAEFTPKNVQTQAERERLVFGVKIGFQNPDETLKPGMTIEVSADELTNSDTANKQ